MDGKFPERVIIKAVQRMLPGGPLSRRQLKNLKVYSGSEHPHQAQQPVIDDFANQNPKIQGELDMVAENNLETLDTENPETANGYTWE